MGGDEATDDPKATAVASLEWVPYSPKLRWRLGFWLGLIGVLLEFLGGQCINHTGLFSVSGSDDAFALIGYGDVSLNDTFISSGFDTHFATQFDSGAGCDRYKGVIMVCVGSASLFIGILFYLCEKTTTFLDVCLFFARDAFMFGFVLTVVGSGCMEVAECKRCPREAPAGCNWMDGVPNSLDLYTKNGVFIQQNAQIDSLWGSMASK
jgi:hypothetical protein